jgi:hypothetical protein
VPADAIGLLEAVERDAVALEDFHRSEPGRAGPDDAIPIFNHARQTAVAAPRRPLPIHDAR